MGVEKEPCVGQAWPNLSELEDEGAYLADWWIEFGHVEAGLWKGYETICLKNGLQENLPMLTVEYLVVVVGCQMVFVRLALKETLLMLIVGGPFGVVGCLRVFVKLVLTRHYSKTVRK